MARFLRLLPRPKVACCARTVVLRKRYSESVSFPLEWPHTSRLVRLVNNQPKPTTEPFTTMHQSFPFDDDDEDLSPDAGFALRHALRRAHAREINACRRHVRLPAVVKNGRKLTDAIDADIAGIKQPGLTEAGYRDFRQVA
jgi:hypothetical protein